MDLFTQPFFLQPAKVAGNYIKLHTDRSDPTIYSVTTNGVFSVHSIKNGEAVVQKYLDYDEYSLSIQADANTDIYIYGDVTKIYFSSNSTSITSITAVCDTLVSVDASYQSFKEIDLNKSVNVTALKLYYNGSLERLYIGECTSLYLTAANINSGISDIECAATIEATATAIAAMINHTSSGIGSRIVKVVGDLTYADTIKTAADAKGWTYKHITKPIQ